MEENIITLNVFPDNETFIYVVPTGRHSINFIYVSNDGIELSETDDYMVIEGAEKNDTLLFTPAIQAQSRLLIKYTLLYLQKNDEPIKLNLVVCKD